MSIEYIYEVNVSELTDSSQDKIWSEVFKMTEKDSKSIKIGIE